jgi:hypothetical protein
MQNVKQQYGGCLLLLPSGFITVNNEPLELGI